MSPKSHTMLCFSSAPTKLQVHKRFRIKFILLQYDLFYTVQAANSKITQTSIGNHLEYHCEKLSSLWNFENWDQKWRMCSRKQFLFHLFYTTDEGSYKLWKIRHTESKQLVSLTKRISNKFFQCPQSSPPASTRSLQLPFVFLWLITLLYHFQNFWNSHP